MKKVGEYVLLSELGKGQFGVVYKAKNCNTGDIYAIKSVLKSSINNSTKLKTLFNTEISIMSRIKHPNILHLYEYLETNNNYYLVIDFCNNGDMETHVKKHTFLGEEESVYFLMQIMNGFKELHEHKIMHRDFKLANLFLNDDKLIIGDFGFARSGVDMTSTKLGSPITMAPELLLSPPGAKLVYTNKADLWSIGVCFYQMIFGQLPWDVSELEDLKHKVQYQSGSKLHFPTDKVQISPECRDLLIKILEVDAKKRIEWEDLFNHKLFAMHEAKKHIKDAALNMRQSVMFRNNEDNVKKLFDQNKKEDMKEVELEADPDNLNINAVATQAEPVQDAQVVLNRIKTRVISRYTHEKKTIVFFMYTCRRLRNLAKDRDLFKNGSDNLMYAAILLLKKGMIMNDAAVSSLKNETNIYSIEGFEQFAALPDRVRLVDELESKDTHLYNKLFSHLKDKVTEECTASDPRREVIMNLVTSFSCSIQAVDQELKKECSYLIPYFFKSSSGLSTHQRFELMLSLAHTYVSAYQDEYLSYSKEGVPFDWNEYEKSWNGPQGSEKINAILSKAISGR